MKLSNNPKRLAVFSDSGETGINDGNKRCLLVVCCIIYSVYNGKCWEIIIITFVNGDIIIVIMCY